MSEFVGLGDADAESRWIGVRRHQAFLLVVGVCLLGHWLTAPNATFVEALIGTFCLVCASPTNEGLTLGERVLILVHFVVRSRWSSLRVGLFDGVITVEARGVVRLHGFELSHRGRLDLSGRDVDNATSLASFADALATSEVTRHFSTHVIARGDVVSTMLALPEDVSAPAGWTVHNVLASNCVATHSLE